MTTTVPTAMPLRRSIPSALDEWMLARQDIEHDDIQIVYVDGNIGAGKTTWIENTAIPACRGLGIPCAYAPEPIPARLDDFYAGRCTPLELQIEFVKARSLAFIAALHDLVATGGILFVDRSFVGDTVFARVNGIHAERAYLAARHASLSMRMDALCDLEGKTYGETYLYFTTTVDECLSNISTRKRESPSRAYLEKIDACHVARLDGALDFSFEAVRGTPQKCMGVLLAALGRSTASMDKL